MIGPDCKSCGRLSAKVAALEDVLSRPEHQLHALLRRAEIREMQQCQEIEKLTAERDKYRTIALDRVQRDGANAPA